MNSNLVSHYREAIPLDLCDDIISYYKNNGNDVYSSGIADNDSPRIKLNTSLRVSNELILYHNKNTTKGLYDKLIDSIMPITNKWINNHPAVNQQLGSAYYEDVHILRYEPNKGHYGYHSDDDGPTVDNRVLSIIIYLNDVSEGGETEFAYIDVSPIKPSKGDVLVFPSGWTHLHKGNMPISNSKYICVTWLKNLRQ